MIFVFFPTTPVMPFYYISADYKITNTVADSIQFLDVDSSVPSWRLDDVRLLHHTIQMFLSLICDFSDFANLFWCVMLKYFAELSTEDGRRIYSFNSPFTVKFYHEYNFNNCLTVSVACSIPEVRNRERFLFQCRNHATTWMQNEMFDSKVSDGNFTWVWKWVRGISNLSVCW